MGSGIAPSQKSPGKKAYILFIQKGKLFLQI
jgi:hypothetical protein